MKLKIAAAALVLLIGAGVYCGYRYYREDVLPEKQLDEAHDAQIKLYERVKPKPVSPTHTPEQNPLEPAEQVNSNVVGWITINGTHIDYPVCQAEDNDFYLHHGFDGESNKELGCPFLDYRCNSDFGGFNSIVYAHHMTRQRMFADIALFKDQSYLNSHRTGTLTLNDGAHNVHFFAYMTVMSTAPAYHAVFVSSSEQEEYIDYIFSDAVYTTTYTADALKQEKDLHLLLLSTCTYEFEDARGILIGVIDKSIE